MLSSDANSAAYSYSTIALYDFPLNASKECSPMVYNIHSPPAHEEGSTLKAVVLSGDVFAGVLQDDARLQEYRNNPDAQLKPLVPPAGVEQVYFFHVPTSTTRWLHSRHLAVSNSRFRLASLEQLS